MKLYIDKKLSLDENKCNLIADFCLFCADNLPIEGNFSVYIVLKRALSNHNNRCLYDAESMLLHIWKEQSTC